VNDDEYLPEFTDDEFRDLVKLVQQAALKAYPNPLRLGCPDAELLHAIAAQRWPSDHPMFRSHIAQCSPCIEALRAERTRFQAEKVRETRKRRLQLIAAAAVATALAAVFWVVHSHVGTGETAISRTQRAPGVVPQDGSRTGSRTPSALETEQGPKTVSALLNLQETPAPDTRSASGTRDLQHVPRANLSPLLIYLPLGSETGEYRVDVRNENEGSVLASFTGTADIRDGLTVLRIHADLSKLRPGIYVLSVSRQSSQLWLCRFAVG
jgi:hypothetical protein